MIYIFYNATGGEYLCYLLWVMLFAKLIKPLPHLLENPKDWIYMPEEIFFDYLHSIIKIYALLKIAEDW
jgi:hypothetical protein